MKTDREHFEQVSTSFLAMIDHLDGMRTSYEANAQLMIAYAIYILAVALFYKDKQS